MGTVTVYAPIPAALEPTGHVVDWVSTDGERIDTTTIRWENEGFTVSATLHRERVEYVLRLSSAWQVRQCILFRDLEEPDLWLATDGSGRWGEMNGAHRTELDGCYDVHVVGAAFTPTIPIRRLPLLEGHAAEVPVVLVDTDTLEVRAVPHRYTRVGPHTWRIEQPDVDAIDLEVDQHGLVLDYPGRCRRAS